MSLSNLFNGPNDYILYCDEMHCKNIVPPIGGNQGDIFTVNAANQSVFSKTFEGSDQVYLFKNCKFEVANFDDNGPGVLAVGTQSISTQGAVLGMGETDTQNSFFFFYDPSTKNLGMAQNNACVGHDFTMGLSTGNFIVNNKLKLPTVIANNLLKLDGSNVVTNAIATDIPNIYTTDGTLTNETRQVHLNNGQLIFGETGIFTPVLLFMDQAGSNITMKCDGGSVDIGNITQNATTITSNNVTISNIGGLTTLSGSIQLPSYTDGLLQVDGSGNVSTVANSNLGFVTNTTPGNYNITVPANATLVKLTGVGGGGGGCLHIGFASPGGGAAGSIFDYPVSVTTGQVINITVGAGGAVNVDGTDTVFNIGSQTITCGKGLTSIDQSTGGNGGSVNLGFTTIAGGLGGAFQANGANGNSSYFVCSGAGGGGTRANGGNALLFTGGGADANYGGGGASAFANGANNHSNGNKGSGGGADNGSGGDGFVTITFYA